MTKLIYHSPSNPSEVSPFDEAIIQVANGNDIKIISPYIGLEYLERLIDLSLEWILISDIEAWLYSLEKSDRKNAFNFIALNLEKIHHYPKIHAKTVINKKAAYFGSSNMTNAGILIRSEIGALIDNVDLVNEINKWFDEIWRISDSPDLNEISNYINCINQQESKINSPSKISAPKAVKIKTNLMKIPKSKKLDNNKFLASEVPPSIDSTAIIKNIHHIPTSKIDNFIYRIFMGLNFEKGSNPPDKNHIKSLTNVDIDEQNLLMNFLINKGAINKNLENGLAALDENFEWPKEWDIFNKSKNIWDKKLEEEFKSWFRGLWPLRESGRGVWGRRPPYC